MLKKVIIELLYSNNFLEEINGKNKHIKKTKKSKHKKWRFTPRVPLCTLGEVLRDKNVFEPIHQDVSVANIQHTKNR